MSSQQEAARITGLVLIFAVSGCATHPAGQPDMSATPGDLAGADLAGVDLATGLDRDAAGGPDLAPVGCTAFTDVCTGGCVLNLAESAVTVSGTMLWNGAAVPDVYSSATEWYLTFVDTATQKPYSYGFNGGASGYSMKMYPGTYDVFAGLNYQDAPSGAPPGSWKVAGGLVIAGDTTLNVAQSAVTVSGTMLWNGAAVPDVNSSATEWYLTFVDTTTKKEYSHGFNGGASGYSIKMYPGTYDVFAGLNYQDAPSGAPSGSWKVAGGLVIAGDTTLNVAQSAVTVSGTMLWNGAAVPDVNSSATEWYLTFVDTTTKKEYSYGFNGGASGYSMKMYPGTYDVFAGLNYQDAPSGAPSGSWKVAGGLVIAGDTTLNVAQSAVTVSGTMLWNGAAVPDVYSGATEWYLTFVDTATQKPYSYGFNGGASGYSIKMYPGTYDVFAGLNYQDAPSGAPSGSRKVAGGLVIAGDTTLNVAQSAVTVSGTMLWNGAAVPDVYSSATEWYLTFVDTATQKPYSYGFNGGAGGYSMKMYPGTYDVFAGLNYQDAPSGAPPGSWKVAGGLVIVGDTTLNVAQSAVTVSGTMLWNGAAVPDVYSSATEWYLTFVDTATQKPYSYGFNGGAGGYSMKMYPGTYDVFAGLNYQDAPSGAPPGSWKALGCVTIH